MPSGAAGTFAAVARLTACPSCDSRFLQPMRCDAQDDGTGYPDRLAGEEIPLGARIVAVCDAFHAMTSMRPYSPARRVEEALAELRRCAGAQFDPVVVDAFCAALARHGRNAAPKLAPAERVSAAIA